MRNKAEKRRNDYLKAKKKEKIYNSKNKDKDKNDFIRGFFGKLKKGKVPDLRTPNEIENEINSPKKSDKIKMDDMNDQLEEYYNELYDDQNEIYYKW